MIFNIPSVNHRSVSVNGEDIQHNLGNGKSEKSKSQKKASSQKADKGSHQFQLSMLQVKDQNNMLMTLITINYHYQFLVT